MKNHSGCERAFIWSSRAWYAKTTVKGDKVSFGMYARNDGTSGEMTMRWHRVGGRNVPRLEVFDDAWNALAMFPDLIQALGRHDDKRITPEAFIEILRSCGFADFTPYQRE